MAAQPAKGGEEILHRIVLARQLQASGIEAEDAIDAAGHRARVEPGRAKADPAELGDPAGVPEIGVGVFGQVRRREVERGEAGLDLGLLGAVDDHDAGRDAVDGAFDLVAMAVGGDFDHGCRRVLVAIAAQQVEDLEEILVQRGLAAEEADAVPVVLPANGFIDEVADLVERHMKVGKRLPARPVAVMAAQIAGIRNVNLNTI